MRVLITGASGMLGATLVNKWKEKFDIFATSRKNIPNSPIECFRTKDLSDESYDKLIDWANPDIIVHCAAITNVDYCEGNPDQAFRVNGESVIKFINSIEKSKLIFISTDAVFPDGTYMPSEDAETKPENIYGLSKSLGEKRIDIPKSKHAVVRTTIVGKNINLSNQGFVEWIINSVKGGREITLFDDVIFTPITIWSLADELEWIINNDISGLIHIAGIGEISKYEFGRRICEGLGLDTSLVHSGSIDNIPFKAKRSKDQTINANYYQKITGRKLPSASDTIDLIIQNFKESIYA